MPSRQDFNVLVDGAVVAHVQPSDTSYQAYATTSFAVTAGSHTIAFQGLNSAGGDNSALLDAVSIAVAVPVAPVVGDSSFESVSVGNGGFAYNPLGTAWTFVGNSGLSGNGSGFTSGNPNAPDGSQVAILQTTSAISQTITGWAAGSYQISFMAAQRGNNGTSAEDFRVLVDGKTVGTFQPSGTSYQSLTTSTFTVGSGSHTIQFQGIDTLATDNTAFLDQVKVALVGTGDVTWTVYNGTNPYADFNGSGTLLTRYLTGAATDSYLAQIGSLGTVVWYLTDHEGSVRDLANTSGAVIDHVAYDSYGNVTSEISPSNGDRMKFDGMA